MHLHESSLGEEKENLNLKIFSICNRYKTSTVLNFETAACMALSNVFFVFHTWVLFMQLNILCLGTLLGNLGCSSEGASIDLLKRLSCI